MKSEKNTGHKVLQILYSGLGGHGSVVFSLLEAGFNKVYENELLFYGIEPLLEEYQAKCLKLNIPFHYIKSKQGNPINAWISVIKLLIKARPSVILLHSATLLLPVSILSRSLNVKLIFIEHTPNIVKTRFEQFCSRTAMMLANKIVVLSDAYANELKSILKNSFRQRKVVCIPNGIDTKLYIPAGKKVHSDFITIGMVSRFSPSKDHLTLIKVVADLHKDYPNIKLRLAGDGVTFNEVQNVIIKMELQDIVLLEGMLSQTSLVSFFQSLDIYAHASKGETMCTAIMQAMSCSLPVVASNIPGINNLVSNRQSGFLCANENLTEWRHALSNLLNNNLAIKEFGDEGRKIALSKFTNQRMFSQYTDLIN